MSKLAKHKAEVKITAVTNQMTKPHVSFIRSKPDIDGYVSSRLSGNITEPLQGTCRNPNDFWEVESPFHESIKNPGRKEPPHRSAFKDKSGIYRICFMQTFGYD